MLYSRISVPSLVLSLPEQNNNVIAAFHLQWALVICTLTHFCGVLVHLKSKWRDHLCLLFLVRQLGFQPKDQSKTIKREMWSQALFWKENQQAEASLGASFKIKLYAHPSNQLETSLRWIVPLHPPLHFSDAWHGEGNISKDLYSHGLSKQCSCCQEPT